MPRLRHDTVLVDGQRVFVYRAQPAGEARGTLLAPPLVGASGLQQIRTTEPAVRAGFELVTFDFRGHGRSEGRFSIRNSIADGVAVARALASEPRPGPLIGLGTCYGVVPLAHAVRTLPDAFAGLLLVNPVPSLRWLAGPGDALRHYFAPEGRLRLVNPFDRKAMLLANVRRFFPEIDSSRDHFGILRYRRTERLRCVLEFLFADPLAGLELPGLPALVVHGRADEILRLGEPATAERWRDAFRGLLPEARFLAFDDVDHHWNGADDANNASALAFCEALAGGPRPAEPAPHERVPAYS